jgi:hypothetical protein
MTRLKLILRHSHYLDGRHCTPLPLEGVLKLSNSSFPPALTLCASIKQARRHLRSQRA